MPLPFLSSIQCSIKLEMSKKTCYNKAELPLECFFPTQFPSLRFFINKKKLEIEKTKITWYTTFKTDII
jgi:hypothetical protein